MRLIVTISGNSTGIEQAVSADPDSSSSNALLSTESPTPARENLDPPSLITSDRDTELEAADSEGAKPLEDVPQVEPYLTQRSDRLPVDQADVATSAVEGLASIMFNLDGIMKILDVLGEAHRLVKGTWSLVNAAYQIARDQADLDESIKALINVMDHGCRLAKDHVALKGRQLANDGIIQKILREVIKGASIVRLYCEKRPPDLSVFRTLASNLAQEVQECAEALSTLNEKLSPQVERLVPIEIHNMVSRLAQANSKIDQAAVNELLKEIRYAEEGNRALRDGSRGCLPGTRAEIIDAIIDWALGVLLRDAPSGYLDALDPESRILWLCGVAGAGKSSIAISVAKALHAMGLLGSIYSFQVAKQATLNPTNLFSTIARHIAEDNPSQKQHLVDIIRESDTITRTSLSPADQFEKFLLPLFAGDNGQTPIQPVVIVIDAFDECANMGSRGELLEILARRAHELPAGVRFIVTSRHEEDVQTALKPRTKDVTLLKIEDIPRGTTERDIRAYVYATLKDVRGLGSEEYVPKLTKLALAAEQSFQWASTACLFIKNVDDGNAGMTPQVRLRRVLKSKAGLDPLYRLILDRRFGEAGVEALQALLTVLGCLVYAQEPLSLRAIIDLVAELPPASDSDSDLQVDPHDYYHGPAQALSSLVTGTHDLETPLIALHTSFTDFLGDKARSEKYFVDACSFRERLAFGCLRCMHEHLEFDICKLPTSFKRNVDIDNIERLIRDNISVALSYACRLWPHHLSQIAEWTESEHLTDLVATLLSDRVLEWLEVISLVGSSALDVLGPITDTQIPSVNPRLSNLIRETIQFVTYFAIPIALSAPHIYLSALPFTPTSSLLFRQLLVGFSHMAKIASGELNAWPNIRHILEGHTDHVTSVAFSPDGRLIASGSLDKTIRLWDTLKGIVVGVLAGHSDVVKSVAFSPDGALIASGSNDCTIRIWDVKLRSAVGDPLEGHGDWVQSVAFSPDGALIASGSNDCTIRIWNIKLRSAVGDPLEGHSGWVQSVAFSPDGALIASGSYDCTIRIWDVKSRSAVGDPLEGHGDWVQSVAFSPDGALIASGSIDGTICIWDVKLRSAVRNPLEGHGHSVRSVVFSPDGALIASGSSDCTIRIWDVKLRSAVGDPLEGHGDSVQSVAFSPGGTLIASGSDDQTIRIWDVKLRSAVGDPLEGHGASVQSVACSPDGTLIASGSSDGTIRIWDVKLRSAVGDPLEGHSDWVQSVAFSPDGALIASGSSDCTIRIWDVKLRSAVGDPLEGHGGSVLSVAFSTDGALIASGSNDGTIRIWDVKLRSAVGDPLEGHSDWVQSVAFSPDGALIASGSIDGTIRIWDVKSRSAVGDPLEGHGYWVRSVAFSPDGALIASGSNDCTVRIWDVKLRSAVGDPLEGHSDWVQSVAFSPDGALIASGSSDCTIRIWDVKLRSAVGDPLEGHGGSVLSVAFSTDGALIASGSDDHTIRIWDVKLRSAVGDPLEGHGDSVLSVAFSPDGALIASGSNDHTMRISDMRLQASTTGYLLQAAEGNVSPLTCGLFPSDLQPSLVSLNLSPAATRQLQDGWIVGAHGELVLWIPPSQRAGLADFRLLGVLGNPKVPVTMLNLNYMVCGADWATCRTPDPMNIIQA